jgi:predicted TIM-barrel fold metal-dependent hydrolase
MPYEYQKHVSYYPDTQALAYAHKMAQFWLWTDHRTGKMPKTHPGMDWTAEKLIKDCDEAGVDVACILRESMMENSKFGAPFSTNYHIIEAREKYPNRFVAVSNVGPHLNRGVDNAIWELEYLHTQQGFLATKVYSPEDGPLNDRRLWPFYEKCQELGVVVFFHTGLTIKIGRSSYCKPILLDDVLSDFPDLKVVAYHAGYPDFEELVMLAWKHPNLYISFSLLLPWLLRAPRRFQHMVGLVCQIAGEDRLVWGTDWPGSDPAESVQAVLNLEMPEELQEQYGYAPITRETKAKFFGLNLARLLGIDPEEWKLPAKKGRS